MKKILLSCGVLALAGTLTYAAVSTFATQQAHEQTANHKMLLKAVGHYEGEAWMPGPDGEKQTSKTWETVEAVGQFFTRSEFKMDMGPAGTYEGHGVHGFDPKKGKHVGTWIGSMDPYLSVMEGDFDEKTGEMTMSWDGYNMMGVQAKMGYTWKMVGDGYSMVFTENGAETWGIDMKKVNKPVEASHEMDKDGAEHEGSGHDSDGKEHAGDDGDKGHDKDGR